MRRGLLIPLAAPGLVVVVTGLYAALNRHAWWSAIPLAVAMVSAPLWPFGALKLARSTVERADLVRALNFQLTILVWLAIGGALLLVFVGLFVLLGVVAAEIGFSFDATRRAWNGEPVAPSRTIQFVK